MATTLPNAPGVVLSLCCPCQEVVNVGKCRPPPLLPLLLERSYSCVVTVTRRETGAVQTRVTESAGTGGTGGTP